MENYVSRGRYTGHNRNFRMNSGQNRQFRQAGGLQTGAPMAAAHMQNSDRDRSFGDAATDHSAGKKILYLLLQYIAENSSFFLQTENHASRGSGGSSRHQSEYHQNRNFRQNSGQNRQRREPGGPQPAAPTAAAHVQNSVRGRSFRDPATPHSAAPRGNGGDGGTSSGGSGRGGRGGAHYVAHQPSSEPVATTAAIVTSGRANRAANNSSSMILRGSSTTSVTPIPGAPNQYGWSHHCSALFSWRMGSEVGGIQCLLTTAVSIIIIFFFFVGFNEIGNFLEVCDDLKNRMNFG